MKSSQPVLYALLHRVPYLILMTATVLLLTGATWEIDQPLAPSTRTTTANVAGNGTSDSPGNASFQFGRYEINGFIIENDMDVTAVEIGMTGMYTWSGTLTAPPWQVGNRKGARIEWTTGNDDTSFHKVIQ